MWCLFPAYRSFARISNLDGKGSREGDLQETAGESKGWLRKLGMDFGWPRLVGLIGSRKGEKCKLKEQFPLTEEKSHDRLSSSEELFLNDGNVAA